MRAGHQLAEIVSGHVLHHPPAGLEGLAPPADGAEAEQVVARRSRLDAARAGGVDRDGAPYCSPARRSAQDKAVIRRLEGELLALLVEQALDFAERRARAGGQHQFGRLVERDAAHRRRGEPAAGLESHGRSRVCCPRPRPPAPTLRRPPPLSPPRGRPRPMAPARPSPSGPAAGLRSGAGPGRAERRPGHASARARRSGAGSGRPCPGLSRCSGSKAHLTRCCWSRSASVNIVPMRSRFSTPTPCSPVNTPPTATQSFNMSAPNASAFSMSPGRLAS